MSDSKGMVVVVDDDGTLKIIGTYSTATVYLERDDARQLLHALPGLLGEMKRKRIAHMEREVVTLNAALRAERETQE